MANIYAPRLTSFDYVGAYRYFVTICTFDRERRFVDANTVEPVTSQLLHTAAGHHFAVFAYCFMPDHLHALVAGEHAAADLREFVRIFKQRSAFDSKRQRGLALWQRGYFDHVLRDEEDTFGVARYILENPVRAGLVTDPLDYPYLGSSVTSVREFLYSVQIAPSWRT